MTKTILIGIDAADWKVITPLLEQGELPTIASLIQEGVSAPLKSLPGYKSPALWTSIATGKMPEKNGVLYFSNLFVDIPRLKLKKDLTTNVMVNWPQRIGNIFSKDDKTPSQVSRFARKTYVYSMLKYGKLLERLKIGGNYLVTGTFRTEKTIWEMLSEEGTTVGVIGWLVTWPAEKVNGFMVSAKAVEGSNRIYQANSKYKTENSKGGITYPASIFEELKRFNSTPYSITDQEINSIFSHLTEAEIEQVRSSHFDKKNKFNFFAQLYLSDVFTVKTGNHLRSSINPEFLTVYLPGLDGIQHIFWQYHFSQEFSFLNMPKEELGRFERVIPNYYKFLDKHIASLIEGYETVIIVSDHGMDSIPENHFDFSVSRSGQHEDSPEGILIMKGPSVKKNLKLQKAHILDIAPTVLYLMEKELDQGMDGEIITEAIIPSFLSKNVVKKKDYGKKKSTENSFYAHEEQEEVKDRLNALGYLD